MQRRVASAGWLGAVVLAAVLGAWAFQNANPDAAYASHDPLDESAVRHELHSGGAAGSPEVPGTTTPPDEPSTDEPSGKPPSSSSKPPQGSRTVALKLPEGGATATVQCLADGRIKLAGLSPADGYSVDDVVHGPGKYVTFELEPADDDDDETAAPSVRSSEDEDQVVKARCSDGKPVTSVTREKDDDEDEAGEAS